MIARERASSLSASLLPSRGREENESKLPLRIDFCKLEAKARDQNKIFFANN
jgi:hypothetical protein